MYPDALYCVQSMISVFPPESIYVVQGFCCCTLRIHYRLLALSTSHWRV